MVEEILRGEVASQLNYTYFIIIIITGTDNIPTDLSPLLLFIVYTVV